MLHVSPTPERAAKMTDVEIRDWLPVVKVRVCAPMGGVREMIATTHGRLRETALVTPVTLHGCVLPGLEFSWATVVRAVREGRTLNGV